MTVLENEDKPALHIVIELCKTLEREGIVYCHWKSNAAIERSARGDNDLDLLVSRADAQRFTQILYRLGCKEAWAPREKQVPGILDYYGYDREANRLVHIHVHYQLVLGHDATKNYHLPVEKPYLESAVQYDLFKIPIPEFEFIIFTLRMVLKHSTWDAILGRQGALSASERQELEFLEARINRIQVNDLLREYLPYVDVTLFDDCVRSIHPGCALSTRIKTGQQLRKNLKSEARYPQFIEVFLNLWRRFNGIIRQRLSGYSPKKRLATGGAIVAIVGGDGSGKSTVIKELYTWLSKDFRTTQVHIGKPPWSAITILTRSILKMCRLLGLYSSKNASIQSPTGSNPLNFPGYAWLLKAICTARDRYLTYVRIRRFATNGGVALCDRFPLPFIKLMDGPQIERWTNGQSTNWLINASKNWEKRFYEAIKSPEVLILLKVDPEISVQRKTTEEPNSVRIRSSEIWNLDSQEIAAHIVDASRSAEEVLTEIKGLVWSEL